MGDDPEVWRLFLGIIAVLTVSAILGIIQAVRRARKKQRSNAAVALAALGVVVGFLMAVLTYTLLVPVIMVLPGLWLYFAVWANGKAGIDSRSEPAES